MVYVTGDVAGAEESPVYAILKMNQQLDKLHAARRLHADALQRRAARIDRSLLDEVGRRVADHH